MTTWECADRLAYLKEFRAKVRGALDGSLPASEVESYSLGDGSGGSQSTRRRGPEYFWNLLEKIDAKIDEVEQIERRASWGGGVRTFGANRYGSGL